MKLWPALLFLAWTGSAEARDLTEVYYDYLLADYCALLTPEALAGYRAEVAAADPAVRQRAQSAAELAFEREWGNRGLGGTRPWCRDEGRESAARLAAAQP